MKKFLPLINILILPSLLWISCNQKMDADYILYNGIGYTMNAEMDTVSAIIIKNGKIIDLGNKEILNRYDTKEENIINLDGKTFLPGLTDAHCHLLNYARTLLNVNLNGTKSFEDVVSKTVAFENQSEVEWIQGRGWDQNDWPYQQFPTKDTLDKLFPNKPVYLIRVDGHAALVNQVALDLAGIDSSTKVNGGEIVLENNQPTGVLIDNAMNLVSKIIPRFSSDVLKSAIKRAIANCNAYGLTTFHEAGLEKWETQLLQEMDKNGEINAKIYVMLAPSKENLQWIQEGIPITDNIYVNAIKMYADGALGSRGALLTEPYEDAHNHSGLTLTSLDSIKSIAQFCLKNNIQLNTHCIGDAANHNILKLYSEILSPNNNVRWRVEHAQVVNPIDYSFFKTYQIIPSVQPTHATSDKSWAEKRLGTHRVHWSYSYKNLWEINKMLAIGTDFPIEEINPFYTLYAAVYRKNPLNFDKDETWRAEESLTREQCLRGMTIDAAYAGFMEKEEGTLEIGKNANICVLSYNPFTASEEEILKTKALFTFLNGKCIIRN